MKTAYVPGFDGFAIKISPGFFDNPKLGLPSVNGLMVYLSARTGLVEALLLDNGYLTNVRTAAAGAVAAKHLARDGCGGRRDPRRRRPGAPAARGADAGAPDPRSAHLDARPPRPPGHAAAAEMTAKLGIPVDGRGRCGARRSRGADIVVTTTPATEPILRGRAGWRPASTSPPWVRTPSTRTRSIRRPSPRLTYVADSLAQTRRLGELHHALAAEVVAGRRGVCRTRRGHRRHGARPPRTPTRSRSATSPAPACRTPPSPRLPSPAPGPPAPAPSSTPEERHARRAAELHPRGICRPPRQRTRSAMAARGIDTLIVSDPSNMAWLTGYDGWSFYVHQGVVVPPGRRSGLVGPRAGRAGRAAHRLHGRGPHPRLSRQLRAVDRAPSDAGARRAARASAAGARARSASRWTTTGSRPPPSPRCSSELPNARFVDATALVNWQRAVKSPQELDYMRIAGKIVSAMHALHRRDGRAGHAQMRSRRRDHRRRHARRRRPWRRLSGDRAADPVGVGCRGAAPHLGRQADEGGRGDLLRDRRLLQALPLPAVAHGVPRQADRRPSSMPRRRCSRAWRRGSKRRAPGNICEDIANAFFAVLKRYGIVKDNRTGYPIGLSYPPDWGERTMSLRPGDRTELEARHDLPFHDRPVDGGLGLRDHRDRSPSPTARRSFSPTFRASSSSSHEVGRHGRHASAGHRRSSPRSTTPPTACSTASCACPTAATIPPGAR